ncbi:rod shape-determining protein MreD [Litoreibacter ponti]|uniref:Rod shape-determining protein MreD n=1 Tax=Litoreibacter ponti TaxID=1510457 RepID=A0A2T6BN66_9RHOB|nr:hypothetical protein [Litoreibacter ponti]PTX57437.1 rod shape-determining protein MreD [Litoreibacter ponti]
MVDPITSRRFLYRVVFLVVCMIAIFVKLLPLGTLPAAVTLIDPISGELVREGGGGRIPGPDLLFCFTAAFIMRRPRWAPVLLIVGVHLLADILFLRPVGLWAAISLIGYEVLRTRSAGSTELPIPFEVPLVAGTFAAITLGNALMLAIFAVPQAAFTTTLLQILTTALAYPFVIAVVHFMLRVRRVKPGELEASGAIG